MYILLSKLHYLCRFTCYPYSKIKYGSGRFALKLYDRHQLNVFSELTTSSPPPPHNHEQQEAEKELLVDPGYREFARQYFNIPGTGQRVLIVQPDDRSTAGRQKLTTAELQLAEACALINTLPKWQVIDQVIISTWRLASKDIFSPTHFTRLQTIISNAPVITCVFVAVNQLTLPQLTTLSSKFRLPIYDRYTIVLQIFKENAKTKVAKLQVALAEVLYLRSRLQQEGSWGASLSLDGVPKRSKHGESYIQLQRKFLQNHEVKLRKAAECLRQQRELLRKSRTKRGIPVVAVVGYTNSGKTTLIKALTGDVSIEPKNSLFATLDVTVHQGRLPNNLDVLYVDTVGFITDIPTSLIDAFRATLEDALIADVVVHVRDISHPDVKSQRHNVTTTLSGLLPRKRMDDVLEVCNKIDQLPPNSEHVDEPGLCISAVTGAGLDELRGHIERAVIHATGLRERAFIVPSDGDHLSWLYRESNVLKVTNRDENNLIVHVLISDENYAQFKHAFSRLKI